MEILWSIINGILGLFLQPLFYLFLLFALFMTLRRVVTERRQFRVKTFRVLDEWLAMLKPALLYGFIGSVVFIAFGIVLPEGMLVLIAVCYLLSLLFLHPRFVTPLFAVGVAVLAAYFIPPVDTGVLLLNQWLADLQQVSFAAVVAMLGILMVIEAELIRLWGAKGTAPTLRKGWRGKTIGAQEAKKFWLVPIFVLLPSGALPMLHGWPILIDGPDNFSLLLVPFGFGFYQLMIHDLPENVHMNRALLSMGLGAMILISALVGWYVNIIEIPVGVTLAAIVIRLCVSLWTLIQRKRQHPFYVQRDYGLTVLSVLPQSPAEKMGIRIGEQVQRVNGHLLEGKGDVYTFLQDNAAYCRLEVIDTAGEKRICQTALYEGSHHELGLLFV